MSPSPACSRLPDPVSRPRRPAPSWQPAAGLDSLVQTLLDFEQQPGRYALALREPRALFEHTHAVMLLAAGRPVEGLPPLHARPAHRRGAAGGAVFCAHGVAAPRHRPLQPAGPEARPQRPKPCATTTGS